MDRNRWTQERDDGGKEADTHSERRGTFRLFVYFCADRVYCPSTDLFAESCLLLGCSRSFHFDLEMSPSFLKIWNTLKCSPFTFLQKFRAVQEKVQGQKDRDGVDGERTDRCNTSERWRQRGRQEETKRERMWRSTF